MNSMLLSLFNFKSPEEARYTLIMDQGPFEMRMYQRMICAKITLKDSYDKSLIHGIQTLEDYTGGNNFKVDRIINNGTFYHTHKADSWEIGLILPSDLNLAAIPKPINRAIKIEEIFPGKVGVLKFKGEPSEAIIERRGDELKRWLKFKGLKHQGPVRVERHELSFPLSFLKHSEVQLDVQ